MISIKQSKIFLLFSVLPLISIEIIGQTKNFNTENEYWFQGNLQLMNNEIIDGELNYNFVSQILRVRKPGKIENFIAENVVFFELQYEDGTKKTFYSLPYKDGTSDRDKPIFFSVVHEAKGVAILSRFIFELKDPNWLLENAVGLNNVPIVDPKFENVKEWIYLIDASGKITPYLEGKKSKSFNLSLAHDISNPDAYRIRSHDRKFEKSKSEEEVKQFKVIDKNALYEFTGDYFYDIEDFIDRNNLKSNTIKGLIKIIDHYSKIKDR